MQSIIQDTIQEYSWPEQFYYFALFRTLNGPEAAPGKDCDAPIDSDTYYTQADLCAWIRMQNVSRKAFLDGKPTELTANQIKVLDGMSFPWVRDSSERWDGHFRELLAYKEKHGHCNVPRRSCKLGIWVINQRAAYHKLCDIAAGREVDHLKRTTAVITPDQIKLLEDIGFQWKIREDFGITWDRHFENLKAYKEQHGHTRVSPKEIKYLGNWVAGLRRQHKRKARGEGCSITEEQFARLNEIGFEWQRPTADPEERQRREQETRRKKNERKKRMRQEAKLRKQEEAEAALKEYRPRARKRRTDDASPAETSSASTPKEDAGTRHKSSGGKSKGRAGKPGAKEWEAIGDEAEEAETVEAALKKYRPRTKKQRTDDTSPTEKLSARTPKKDAGARRTLSGEKGKARAKKPEAKERTTKERKAKERNAIPRAKAVDTDTTALHPSVERIKDSIDRRLEVLRRVEEERARKIRKISEDRRKSGMMVVSRIVKLAAGAPMDEGTADGERGDPAGEIVPTDEETGELPPGSATSNMAKLAARASADEGSADVARTETEEWGYPAGENAPMDEDAGRSSPGSTASSMVKLAANAPAGEGSADEARNWMEEWA